MVTSSCQRAQAVAEYSLVLALVSVVSIASLMLFGSTIAVWVSNLAQTVRFSI